MNRTRLVISIVAIVAMLAGCGKGAASINNKPVIQKGESKPNINQGIKLVKKKEKTKYLLSNGIEVKMNETRINNSKGEKLVYLPTISGLVDKSLELKLNNNIYNDVQQFINDYSLRKELKDMELYCKVELNANNLLSISVSQIYGLPLEGFLYRLTDGKRLELKDIFTEGTDYLSLVNQMVVRGIIRGNTHLESNDAPFSVEENSLGEAFTTISQNQDFCFSSDNLYIIFKAGEGGFLEDTTITIPMKEIDDYVWALDIYSGTERKIHERKDLIIRHNNIFMTEKGELVHKQNGDIYVHYYEISGLRDNNFEKMINDTIKVSINELVNSSYFDKLKKMDYPENAIAEISIYPEFNEYGILTIKRYVSDNNDTNNLGRVFSFDLINKKSVDTKSILKNYIEKNGLQELFMKRLQENMKKYNTDKNFNTWVDGLNYSYIMNNCIICFQNTYNSNIEAAVDISGFKDNNGTHSYREVVSLKDIVKITPEEFFAQ